MQCLHKKYFDQLLKKGLIDDDTKEGLDYVTFKCTSITGGAAYFKVPRNGVDPMKKKELERFLEEFQSRMRASAIQDP